MSAVQGVPTSCITAWSTVETMKRPSRSGMATKMPCSGVWMWSAGGGGPGSVANHTPLPERKQLDPPGNGQWIYLFTPTGATETITVGGEPVKVGKFAVEKLVDLSKHNYSRVPNVTITPDNKWVVFRSNIHGATHTYAAEVARSK